MCGWHAETHRPIPRATRSRQYSRARRRPWRSYARGIGQFRPSPTPTHRYETTTNLLSNAVRRLLEHRATAWEPLCRDPGLIPNAIEEVLRYDSPVVIWRRKTKQPVQLRGVDIPAEANLLLLLGSANRDADVFADPEMFDILRPNAREHLSFGLGNHMCLGAPLARLEARVVLEELTRRRPHLQLIPDQTLTFHPNISFRGPSSLVVGCPVTHRPLVPLGGDPTEDVILRNPWVFDPPAAMKIESRGVRPSHFHRRRNGPEEE